MSTFIDFINPFIWDINTWINILILIHALVFLCWYAYGFFLTKENTSFFIKKGNQSMKPINEYILQKTQPLFLVSFQILKNFLKIVLYSFDIYLDIKVTLVGISLILIIMMFAYFPHMIIFYEITFIIIYGGTKICMYVFVVQTIRKIIEQNVIPMFAIFVLIFLGIFNSYLLWFVWLDNIALFLSEPKINIFGYDVGSSLKNDIYYFMGLLLIWIVLTVLVLLRSKQDRIFINNN